MARRKTDLPDPQGKFVDTKDVYYPPKRRKDLANWGQDNVQPGDNAKYLAISLHGMYLPKIDVGDPKQVEERINYYFAYCMNHDHNPLEWLQQNAIKSHCRRA